MLGLIWGDIDLAAGELHLRAQLSRAHHDIPPRRVPPKTKAAYRDIPLAPQLISVLSEYRRWTPQSTPQGWVFATGNETPLGHRNAERRALQSAAERAGLNDGSWPPLRFHDLRHTFASHLIIDLRLDVAQVSRILGHARVTTTLDVYTHMFDEARHTLDVRAQMAGSAFADLLDRSDEDEEERGSVITLPQADETPKGSLSAKERAALRWAT